VEETRRRGHDSVTSAHLFLGFTRVEWSLFADAMREVTEDLLRLDVASWRPELTEALAAIRGHGRDDTHLLAPGYPARAVRVLALAQRLAAIAELAGADDGAAISGSQARIRSELLRELERSTRRAQVAAYHAILEPDAAR